MAKYDKADVERRMNGAVDSFKSDLSGLRTGRANTALSGWASALVREPLAGRTYTCPVTRNTAMACISVGKVVEKSVFIIPR